jgi:hypothetical protein
MRIDLHVHSRYSTRPSQWVLQKLGCQECYTEPQENLIPEETGIIVPGNDAEALRVAITRLVADPARLKRMGMAARRYVKERSFDNAFLATWKIYEEKAAALNRIAAAE